MWVKLKYPPWTRDLRLCTQLWPATSERHNSNPQPWRQVVEQRIFLFGHSASCWALLLLGNVTSHPSFSQVMGANGQAELCAPSCSNSTTSAQPLCANSQRIFNLLMIFLRSGRAGFRSLPRTFFLQFGQECFVFSHLEMHAEQKTWRQGDSTGSSKTPAQMEHMSSGLTSGNLSRSIPMVTDGFSSGI